MAKLLMNPAWASSGGELCKGLLGTKLSPNGNTSCAAANSPNARKISYPSISCSETRGRRHRRAALAVEEETKVGQGDKNGSSNGAANGAATAAAKIRESTKLKKSSVYDYSDPAGPRSVYNYMEQVWMAATLLSSFHRNRLHILYAIFNSKVYHACLFWIIL